MAKKNGNGGAAVADTPPQSTAIVPNQQADMALRQHARPFEYENADSADETIPRVVLHQGDISEKYYGKHEKGTLIHSQTMEVLPSRKFVVAGHAWTEYIAFGDNLGDPIKGRTRDKSTIPAGGLEWKDGADKDGKPEGIPPVWDTFWNFLVLFDGCDSPIVLSLRRSGGKEHRKAYSLIKQMCSARAAAGKPSLLFEYGTALKENKQGRWLVPQIGLRGEPPVELAAQAAVWADAFSGREVKVAVDAGEHQQAQQTTDYDPAKDG